MHLVLVSALFDPYLSNLDERAPQVERVDLSNGHIKTCWQTARLASLRREAF